MPKANAKCIAQDVFERMMSFALVQADLAATLQIGVEKKSHYRHQDQDASASCQRFFIEW